MQRGLENQIQFNCYHKSHNSRQEQKDKLNSAMIKKKSMDKGLNYQLNVAVREKIKGFWTIFEMFAKDQRLIFCLVKVAIKGIGREAIDENYEKIESTKDKTNFFFQVCTAPCLNLCEKQK